MPTTLDLDEELLRALQERHPGASTTQAIELAVRAYLARDAYEGLRDLRGRLDLRDVSADRRTDRCV